MDNNVFILIIEYFFIILIFKYKKIKKNELKNFMDTIL